MKYTIHNCAGEVIARGDDVGDEYNDYGRKKRRVIPDGATVRVSLADALASDAAGYGPLHRPGSLPLTDAQRATVNDERTAAYEENRLWLQSAWKAPPSQTVSDAQIAHNAASAADANKDHEAAYQEHLAWLKDAWRGTAA